MDRVAIEFRAGSYQCRRHHSLGSKSERCIFHLLRRQHSDAMHATPSEHSAGGVGYAPEYMDSELRLLFPSSSQRDSHRPVTRAPLDLTGGHSEVMKEKQ